MRLVLDPAEEAAHARWLAETPGAYEWWYFDALSDDGRWALACIWFLGNPFSPYYRLSASGRPADPLDHNALFFALYENGRLHAYHFSRFPRAQVQTPHALPGEMVFGDNRLRFGPGGLWTLSLSDLNANGRRLEAAVTFEGWPLVPPVEGGEVQEDGGRDVAHSWLPAAPACRVRARIGLRAPHNAGEEVVAFRGAGYHDHNWGRLPFAADIRDWYWARAALGDERAVILYHVRPRRGAQATSHLLVFDRGRIVRHDAAPRVSLSRPQVNAFGTLYAGRLTAESGGLTATFDLNGRLDSAPFYVRLLGTATVRGEDGRTGAGRGIGEYLRPGVMAWPLVASAMKARIVEQR